ncbi:MAG TPA: hypothetical protein VFZ34_05490 [Blastocatellia bacterium]|nr:hypothetical protein [Blastocatellia bacterium]
MQNALGIVQKLRPGDDIDARCGKCKDVRTHAIIAVSTQGQVERVQCRTCQGTHNYKNPAPKRTTTATTRSSGGSSRASASALVPTGPTKPYSPRESFQIGDQISHPNFGIGLVSDVRAAKIDVKFGRETKTLIHAG